MADKNKKNQIKSVELLPNYYQTDSNKKFLHATIEQLIQPGTVKKINGYVGRQNAKATVAEDIFITEPTTDRQNYQLEPSLIIKDDLGNTTFYKDYIDYINQLSVFGSNVSNHRRLNEQEFYSWDPHIDWDKFVNFQNYYWLPYGPDVINISGQQQEITSTFEVIVESQGDSNAYIFSPKGAVGLVRNPTIKLYKGQTYYFDISSIGNVFSIKTDRTGGIFNRYEDPGLVNNAIESGTITFTVPNDAPDILYYISESDIDLGGVFEILPITENTEINVEEEILGKKTYTLVNGTPLSNGMKVKFIGKVTPVQYETGFYYVEGVGDSIKLIDEKVLELVGRYTTDQAILFDTMPFDSMPFSDSTAFPGTPDYIVINRNSNDHNPWSRYNRWFHKDVIETSATNNNKVASLDQTARAVRPIIEFEGDLKLHNFGTNAINDVDLIDNFTTDVFSTIEGQLGYNIDGIDLAQDQRVLFTADNDILVKNKIFRVQFLTLDGIRQLHLELETEPTDSDVVLVQYGLSNQGQMYWYDSSTGWTLAQQKVMLNQQPLFDVVDENTVSYSDNSVYDGSTFSGTKLFSYKQGVGTNDPYLGFPLSYKNISNIGDIVFEFNLSTDYFQYKDVANIITTYIKTGSLIKTVNGIRTYVNGWQKCTTSNIQAAVRIYKDSALLNNFPIDLYNNKDDLNDLKVFVYINGIRLDRLDSTNNPNWYITENVTNKVLSLTNDISSSDVLSIRTFAVQPINDNGYYEIPINLQNNPLNEDLINFTLGEVIDHVGSIAENSPNFAGSTPGSNNLRDLGNVTQYGTKFVQHSGPLSLGIYHITSETNNVIRAIEKANTEYNKFKKNFITISESLGIDADPIKLVDLILQRINKDKPVDSPYYFSDMVPYGASKVNQHTVVDYRIKSYPLTSIFDLDSLSNKAVIVYRTTDVDTSSVTTQLLYEIDYTFDSQGFVVISSNLVNDDIITIYEYDDTNGSFIPATPTKLGMWPKYEPKKYLNTALVTPREMIQGHDGSQIVAYGDYRDDLILELEKRIFNNIKIKYDSEIFDVYDIIPGYNRTTEYSLQEFNTVLAPYFYKWTSLIDRDFTKQISYDRDNPLTYNYRNHTAPDGTEVPGYWRGIYRWMLDTDRPNIAPWEMLGISQKPAWWESLYGPAPYTRDNLILWQDLSEGMLREPGKPARILKKFVRPFLIHNIPVDEVGNIASPVESGLVYGVITQSTEGDFVFGDGSPVESAWRTSSYYPFSVITSLLLLKPAKIFGLLLDRSRIVKNLAGQMIYKDTGLRVTPADVVLPNIYASSYPVYTSGIINYIIDYILSDHLKSYDGYKTELENLKANISYRVGGFTSREKFRFILDSKTPLSSTTVFVPQEDYDVILNKSSSTKKLTYSGVIITRFDDGYEIKGYSKTQPYFKYYDWLRSGPTINIGGISESYSVWASGQYYGAGSIVKYNSAYYRTVIAHRSSTTFVVENFEKLSSLPMLGGRDAIFRTEWDQTSELILPYNTKFREIQDVVDFLLGYGEWLKAQGFRFDEFNSNLKLVTNWETSAKEFMFWTTQNWSTGEDKWDEWLPMQEVAYESIVRYNGDYYRAIRTIEPASIFNFDDYVKLEGLSTVGSSIISLSPSAERLTFSSPFAVVEDIRDEFNGYEIFDVDGSPIKPNFLSYYKEDNLVTYVPVQGSLYCASFYLKQIEQVIVFNNSTMFNDTIYNPASGYRQERIRASGYKTSEWDGSFNAPGFVLDRAIIQEWQSWQDYNLGDIVKYKEFYYSAKKFLVGVEYFNITDWVKLDQKPTSRLIPNWTYKASQFEDFYSLDSDNFDSDQQTVAQHLIGYQKRQYLDNIIKDDVSEYKFYQGMITEKGTQNVLNKLFDVLSATNKESLDFYEEWAIRVGNYGASCAFENIEFILDEAEFKINPQGFELVNIIDENKTDFIIRQTPNDVYLKPIGYNSSPWTNSETATSYLRSPGYARVSDVQVILDSISDIVNTDITTYTYGDYIWCGFEKQSWNIYKFVNSDLKITLFEYDGAILTVTVDRLVDLEVGEYIGLNVPSISLQGFFNITSVTLDQFTINATDVTLDALENYDSITIFKFVTHRLTTIDDIDSINDVSSNGELIWTDNSGNNKWATWEYNSVYTEAELSNTSPQEVEVDSTTVVVNFGKTVLVNNDGNIAIVANTLGELLTYDKASPNAAWTNRDTIVAPFVSKPVGLVETTPDGLNGDVLSMSPNNLWLAVGVPSANNACTQYVGSWDSLTVYAKDEIVKYNGLYYQAKGTIRLTLTSNVTASASAFVYQPSTEAYGYLEESVTASNLITLSKNSVASFDTTGDIIINNDATPGTFDSTVRPTVVTQISTVPTNSIPSSNRGYWNKIYYVPVDPAGDNSSHTMQGAVSIYRKDNNNIFTLIDTIISPTPSTNEKFGWAIVVKDTTMFVSAVGYNNNTGIVYRLDYEDRVEATAYYNPIGSSGQTIKVSNTENINEGMFVKGTGFESNQYVAKIVDQSTLILNAAPNSEPTGNLEFTIPKWGYTSSITSPGAVGEKFGHTLVLSKDQSTLAISAPGTTTDGKVYVYTKTNGIFNLTQTITGTDSRFGESITMSDIGAYLAISALIYDGLQVVQGTVTVYTKVNGLYVVDVLDAENPPQQLVPINQIIPDTGDSLLFGTKISFMNDYKTLVVYSQDADTYILKTFTDGTTFDNEITRFVELNVDSGRVDIYDQYLSKWVFSETLNSNVNAADTYGSGFSVGKNKVLVGAKTSTVNSIASGRVYEYSKVNLSYTWSKIHQEGDKINLNRIKKAYLYDKSKNEIASYIDVIDPSQGKIPGPAEQEIKFKTFYDPAVYSIGTTNVVVDDGMAWGSNYVGLLWWDLTTAKFIESNSTDVVYRNNTWNTLFPTASIDVYEWVETDLTPAEWDDITDTEEGLADGISGTSLYGETVYSVTKKYDNVSRSFKNTYYFWVKNKKTIPNLWSRKISAQDVSDLISNPRGEGYRFLGITGTNSFTLCNVEPLLKDKDIVLSIEYWINDNNNRSIHSQWNIINNSSNSKIPSSIEQKWFDSLCGKDDASRLVPDMSAAPKLRYGIENRPRQGMFINRFEALKQIFEKVNRVLITRQITEQRDLSQLETYNEEPGVITGLYDEVLDTDLELRFAAAGIFVKPVITPIIKDGKITGIDIVEKGKGYINAPYIEVVGSGEGAVLKTKINSTGQVIGVDVERAGQGYDSNTVLVLRNYCVLVHTDTQTSGGWSIYSYDTSTKVWSRIRSQSYDTRNYWNYVDWYDTGYNQFTIYEFAVDTFVELTTIDASIGDIVKVRTNNSNRWMLLEKYAEADSIDWTLSYKVVGLQDGTIQFSSSIYSYLGTIYGYDGTLYDTSVFDIVASIEIRYILKALRDDILIDDLKPEYINLFFITLRYALSEQLNIDWAFKTSFVKVQHSVGELKQKVTYNNDNLSDFEKYVAEVKPYRTQIREYVSSYSKLDNSNSSVTDFDLMPVYQNGKLTPIAGSVINGEIVVDNNAVTTYPWKFWLDNVGYLVTELRIVDGGSGYKSEPIVRFTSDSGTGATAKAFIANGKVNRVLLVSQGTGYLSAPTVIIDGGLDTSGVAARVVAVIGNSVVRTNLIKVKFDRITSSYFITQLSETETFTGTGTRVQFPLTWAPDIRIGKSTVLVNGVDELRDTYKLSIIKSTSRGYTSYLGAITFDVAPAVNAVISVTYLKDWSVLSAADRIQYYYNPAVGELGKDLGQLMTGIDYGGVVVHGLNFEVGAGWDSVPYYNDKWDSFDTSVFDDYIVVVDAGTSEFELPYVPDAGTEINVYYSKLKNTTYISDGNQTVYTFDIDVVYPPTVTVTRTTTTSGLNEKGNFTITVLSSTGIAINDIVTISPVVSNVIGFNTRVTNINGNIITLDQIIFDDITAGTTLVFTRTLIDPTDCRINKNGTVILETPVTSGNNIIISSPLRPVRIDDPNYGTPQQENTLAVMETWFGDGTESTVSFEPSNFIAVPEFQDGVQSGDKFILRKSTSDGSIAPQAADYDTALTGGDLAYSTATGLAADDIIVDGDGFVTPVTSNAPEEVVPGQVVDTVAIKVYDRPSNGSANIKVDTYIADGIQDTFTISQQINSKEALIVKITEGVSDQVYHSSKTVTEIQQYDVDYTVDYRNSTITFDSPPVSNNIVSIFSFGFNGSNILDLNYIIGDGVTNTIVTTAPWVDNFVFLIYIDGQPIVEPDIEIFKTENSSQDPGRIAIRFREAPNEQSLVNYVIVSGTEQSFSITQSERFVAAGLLEYSLQNKAGVKLPIESSMIVRVDQKILAGPINSYFTIKNNRKNYNLDKTKFAPYSVSADDIVVIVDQTVLTQNSDYVVNINGITITINKAVYDQYVGKEMIVSVLRDSGYMYIPGDTPIIRFEEAYNNNEAIEVISSYNHDILDIQRTAINVTATSSLTVDTVEYYDYLKISTGKILLDRSVIDDQYIWVIRNGTLLTPSVDFKLNDDRLSITLAVEPLVDDQIVLMTYSSNVLTSGIAYMQFKDMLNRTHYKRLSQNKQTTLVEDLRYYDLVIRVEDARTFDSPNPSLNKPGVIEIRGERIEYFSVITEEYTENDITRIIFVLGQLRRGTLGTGTPTIHRKGAFVQEIGSSESIPYTDNNTIEQIISEGTNIIDLSFVPTKTSDAWTYNNGFVSSIPEAYGQTNDIEVFVGGYEISEDWSANTSYVIDKIIKIGSYTYRCIEAHTSSSSFKNDNSKWQFFAGNIRLKKKPYKIYNVNEHPESTEGDIQFDADFAVDGTSKQLRLTNKLAFGTQVTVIKKTGKVWDSELNIQYDNSKVANFLKATPGIWYTGIDKYESISSTASTFDSSNGTFDGTSITFDQG